MKKLILILPLLFMFVGCANDPVTGGNWLTSTNVMQGPDGKLHPVTPLI